jgi:hypothetical protein
MSYDEPPPLLPEMFNRLITVGVGVGPLSEKSAYFLRIQRSF